MEGTQLLTVFGISHLWNGLSFLPIALYAETHYRFKYFFSFLKKKEPEIVADAPHRLDPHGDLPLLVFVKDADRFPCELTKISVTVQDENFSERIVLFSGKLSLTEQFWWHIYHIPSSRFHGSTKIDTELTISLNGSLRTYRNDNYRTSSHKPLHTYISDQKLPRLDGLFFGEVHSHSNYTSDQVEYGAPIGASAELCKSMGLSFFCVTDHSYDLDDPFDNYLKTDSALPKWKALDWGIKAINEESSKFTVIKGEEISCRNKSGRNVHFLLLGNGLFFPGSGDSAERWLHMKSEHSISDVLDRKEVQAIPIAAHPFEKVSFLERLLLLRGEWHPDDFQDERLQGIQFINGDITHGFHEGYEFWKKQLLAGKRMFLFAGNDAHGNFNRYRQLRIPFISIHEHEDHLFGKMRTGVYMSEYSQKFLLAALKNGQTIATDGPVANFTCPGREVSTLGTAVAAVKDFTFSAFSTPEFGPLKQIRIFSGIIGDDSEKTIFSAQNMSEYKFVTEFSYSSKNESYIRAEVWTDPLGSSDKKSHFCLTNPFWISSCEL
jgi:hypothetical protein